jgi:hypothetical protein
MKTSILEDQPPPARTTRTILLKKHQIPQSTLHLCLLRLKLFGYDVARLRCCEVAKEQAADENLHTQIKDAEPKPLAWTVQQAALIILSGCIGGTHIRFAVSGG